jgi:hypothetical protein
MPGTLDYSPAKVVRQALIDMGLGTAQSANGSWPVFYAGEPDGPDSAITVYDTIGTDTGRENIQGERAEHNGIQIRIRSAAHDAGWQKTNEIGIALDQQLYRRTVTIGAKTFRVHQVSRTSTLETRGKEAPTTKRSLFFINAKVSLRQL